MIKKEIITKEQKEYIFQKENLIKSKKQKTDSSNALLIEITGYTVLFTLYH